MIKKKTVSTMIFLFPMSFLSYLSVCVCTSTSEECMYVFECIHVYIYIHMNGMPSGVKSIGKV